jgi:hypothetical protein
VTLLIEPSDSGVRFTTSEWTWSGELQRAVRAFNIRRAVIGGGFQGVEIYANGGAQAIETMRCARQRAGIGRSQDDDAETDCRPADPPSAAS